MFRIDGLKPCLPGFYTGLFFGTLWLLRVRSPAQMSKPAIIAIVAGYIINIMYLGSCLHVAGLEGQLILGCVVCALIRLVQPYLYYADGAYMYFVRQRDVRVAMPQE